MLVTYSLQLHPSIFIWPHALNRWIHVRLLVTPTFPVDFEVAPGCFPILDLVIGHSYMARRPMVTLVARCQFSPTHGWFISSSQSYFHLWALSSSATSSLSAPTCPYRCCSRPWCRFSLPPASVRSKGLALWGLQQLTAGGLTYSSKTLVD